MKRRTKIDAADGVKERFGRNRQLKGCLFFYPRTSGKYKRYKQMKIVLE